MLGAAGARSVLRRSCDALARVVRRAPVVVINRRRYRLLQELGRGGHATLHIATGEEGGRYVLKRPAQCFDDEDEALFAAEYRVLSSLRHPNIVRAVDFGVDPGSGDCLIVMEYVPGKRLWEGIHDLAEVEVAHCLFECLQVCDYLAQRGVAHCDLKPDNILIATDRSIRIADVGVATPHGEPLKGWSPAFVAPEHAGGAQTHAHAATDLYSLGVCFYWLLTGRHPYVGGGAAAAAAEFDFAHRPAAPTQLNPTLDRRWDRCLLGLVDVDPAQRSATAARLLALHKHKSR